MSSSTAATSLEALHEFPIGTEASFCATIDRSLIDRFAEVSGDHNPLHMDEEYARESAFGSRIAHGMICGAFFSRLVGEHLPGERALYRSQDLRFVKPIRPGTEVRVRGVVVAHEPELSLLRIQTVVESKSGDETFVEGEGEVVVRPAAVQRQRAEQAEATVGAALADRTYLVIGGSSGIGRSIAEEFGRQGAHLHVGYRSDRDGAESACEVARSLGRDASSIGIDLSDLDAVVKTVESLGPIDGIVHCGFGSIVKKGVERGTWAEMTDAFQRSVGGLYHAVTAALPGMRERGCGSIVAVSSTVTMETPPPNWAAYTVAKSALVGLVRSLAVELGPFGIRANCVSPTLTETEPNRALPPRILDDFRARSPLGRLATPEDVARAVVFLASDQSSFLTGVDLPLAGGMVMP